MQIADGAGQNTLVRLAFTKAQATTALEWEHSREFEYKGEMYDVVKAEEKGDSLIYHCIWDKAETAINRQLDNLVRMVSNNNPQNKQDFKLLLDFFKSLFCTSAQNNHPHFAALVKQPHFYRFSLPIVYTLPAVPPPRACCNFQV